METSINLNRQIVLPLKVSTELENTIVVCSHERSGTHFLMNSIANNSNYTTKPWVDLDDSPFFGSHLNFFRTSEVDQALYTLARLEIEGKQVGLNSIVKSHHSVDFFDASLRDQRLKFIYIMRNPEDTLRSFWRFLNGFDFNIGTRASDALKFAQSAPEGYLMRYQSKSFTNYFERWAAHVEGWHAAAAAHSENILLVKYADLKDNFSDVLSKISDFASVDQSHKTLSPPSKEAFYFKGSDMEINDADDLEFKAFINESLHAHPTLKELFSNV